LIDVGEHRRSDLRSVAELFAVALAGDYEDEEAWDAVAMLRMRGTTEIYAAAVQLCSSEDPRARERGLDVLGQLGAGKPDGERLHLHDCVSRAIRHLSDPDPTVVCSAAWALAHVNTKAAAAALIPLTGHEDQTVRHAVALALHGDQCSSPGAVPAVLELMRDPSDEVRDWQPSLSDNRSQSTRRKFAARYDRACEISTRTRAAKQYGAWRSAKTGSA
jgi:HEAT repeat protein